MSLPRTPDLAEDIAALAHAHVAGDQAAVDEALRLLAQPVRDVGPRAQVDIRLAIAVHRRDSWTCRYCGGKTIAPPVLRVLSSLQH